MAQVPSWSELCMAVDELSKTQKECYDSVHNLLDPGIPDLDRKIRYLMSKPNDIPLTSTRTLTTTTATNSIAFNPVPISTAHSTYTRPKTTTINTVPTFSKSSVLSNTNKEAPPPIATTSSAINVETIPITTSVAPAPPAPINVKKSHRQPPTTTTTTISVSPPPPPPPPPAKIIIPIKSKTHRVTNGFKTTTTTTNNNDDNKNNNNDGMKNGHKMSIENLKHLRGLKMPLCEYLRRNRPDILMNVEARSSYIRKISEERKSQRAYRIISSLERIRISSNNRKRNYQQQNHRQSKQISQKRHPIAMNNFDAPDYAVRHKVSEREMKQLTLRNYRRLPEVKKQKLEEVNKHLKEQYYKNRQLYGRMLLNNFKNGIINYPLRASYDDRSITSSQSEYSMSQSADTACSSVEPLY